MASRNLTAPIISDLRQDLRHGFRMLARQPGFTWIASLILALGIGANTALFSLFNTVLLRPLPVADPAQIVEITPLRRNADLGAFSYPYYREIRDRNDALDGLAAFRFVPLSVSRGGSNERMWGYLVSGNYFDLLGVKAFAGRTFTQEEDGAPGANPVVVISYGCWQRFFGGDPRAVGSTMVVNNHSFTIIGVAPPAFSGTVLVFTPEVYAPMSMAREIEPGSNWLENPSNGVLFGLGRLKRATTVAQAKASLDALASGLEREYTAYDGISFDLSRPGLVVPAFRNATLGFAGALLVIVGTVLVIACVNLANLLLARAGGRRREIAVRLAIGASRGRLVRQLLTESALLACAGGALGVIVAWWLTTTIESFRPQVDFALNVQFVMDWRVLIFSALLSLVTAVLFGLIPALHSTAPDLVRGLKEGTLATTGRPWLRHGLVVTQVALSLALLAAAGLIVRSLQHVEARGPGFDVEHTVTASVDLGLQGYDRTRGLAFFRDLVAQLESQPGVSAASIISYLPLNLDRSSSAIYVEGQPITRRADLPEILTNAVWPRYFDTMDIAIREGRDFTRDDERDEARPAIVNETFARRFWPDQSAIGRRLARGGPDRPLWEVVGVAKDSKYWSIGEDPQPYVYFPISHDYNSSAAIVVRGTSDPRTLLAATRRAVQALDSSLPIYAAKTMTEHMRLSLFPLRTGASVAGGLAMLALLLAGLGTYGVMTYLVSQRTRELGIRLALGANGAEILRLILGQGAMLAVAGVALGLAGALALTRLMTSVLVGVSVTDGATLASVSFLLTTVIAIACYLPARRAAKVDPLITLRSE